MRRETDEENTGGSAIKLDTPHSVVADAAAAGMDALGEKAGSARDSLVYAATVVLSHPGRSGSLAGAADNVRSAIDSGEAMHRFKATKGLP